MGEYIDLNGVDWTIHQRTDTVHNACTYYNALCMHRDVPIDVVVVVGAAVELLGAHFWAVCVRDRRKDARRCGVLCMLCGVDAEAYDDAQNERSLYTDTVYITPDMVFVRVCVCMSIEQPRYSRVLERH